MDKSLIILVLIVIIIILCTFFNKSENFENQKSYQIVGIHNNSINKNNIDYDFNKYPIIIINKNTFRKDTREQLFPDFKSMHVLPDNIGKVQYDGKNYKGVLIYTEILDEDPVYFITFDVNSQPIP